MKIFVTMLVALLGFSGAAWLAKRRLEGTKDIVLHTRDGRAIVIGQRLSHQKATRSVFALNFDDKKFVQYFLSCASSNASRARTFCATSLSLFSPHTVSAKNMSWLEHALLFIFKRPAIMARAWPMA